MFSDMNPRFLRIEANAMKWLDDEANWKKWEDESLSRLRVAKAYVVSIAEYAVLRYKIWKHHG